MKIVADLHTHTIASGHAYSTISEVVMGAKNKGLELVALTEHGPQLPGAPHAYYFGNMRVLPSEIAGVKVLKGVEANIIDDEGNLDLPVRYLKKLDLVLAGLHDECLEPDNCELNTKALINTMKNPYVDVIVHSGNPRYPADYEKLVQAAVQYNVAIEINNSSLTFSRKGSLDNCREIAKLAGRLGAVVSLGSDAHWADHVGEFTQALQLVEEGKIPAERVLNTSVDRIQEYLRERKSKLKKRK